VGRLLRGARTVSGLLVEPSTREIEEYTCEHHAAHKGFIMGKSTLHGWETSEIQTFNQMNAQIVSEFTYSLKNRLPEVDLG
jgi:hypothetical protein